MLKRDYLVKQFEEFGKVMALLMGLKRDGNFPDLLEEIHKAAQKYTSTEITFVESLQNDNLVNELTQNKKLNDDQLKMLADLLFEKAEYYLKTVSTPLESTNCFKKAYTIYSFLKENATLNYSLDMHYKLELLSKMNL
ncbi:MAG: hypothetical protein V4506_16260 [Bacteroidota bacterium]